MISMGEPMKLEEKCAAVPLRLVLISHDICEFPAFNGTSSFEEGNMKFKGRERVCPAWLSPKLLN
jgi:hypothetical protein